MWKNVGRKGHSEYRQHGKWHGGKTGQLARQMVGTESGIVSLVVCILKHPVPEILENIRLSEHSHQYES